MFSQEEYLKNQTSDTLGENMFNAIYNLSFLIGDEKGKITNSTAEAALIGIQILPPGVVVASDIGVAEDAIPPVISSIERETFITEISHKAYQVYVGLKVKDPTMVNSTLSNKSPILNTSSLSTQARNAANVIFLDVLGLYQELLLATVERGLYSVTKSDLSRIDNNIRFLTMLMEDNPKIDYTLLEQLRVLQRTVSYVRYQDFLFVNTYNDRVLELQSYMSDVEGDVDID